jgi:hypothetical protein
VIPKSFHGKSLPLSSKTRTSWSSADFALAMSAVMPSMSSPRSRKLIDPAMAARLRMSVASGAVSPMAVSVLSMARRLIPSEASRAQPAW